jgi:hypothetical protein
LSILFRGVGTARFSKGLGTALGASLGAALGALLGAAFGAAVPTTAEKRTITEINDIFITFCSSEYVSGCTIITGFALLRRSAAFPDCIKT